MSIPYPPNGQLLPHGGYYFGPPVTAQYPLVQHAYGQAVPHQFYNMLPPGQYPSQFPGQAIPLPSNHPTAVSARPGSYVDPGPSGFGQQQVTPTPPSAGYGLPAVIHLHGAEINVPETEMNTRAIDCAKTIRNTMQGRGTDTKTLIKILANKDPIQMAEIHDAFVCTFRRGLGADIKSETSGLFEEGLQALVRGPLHQDVHLLGEALTNPRPGTKEKIVNDVLLGRSNADLNAIKEAYKQTFHEPLEVAIDKRFGGNAKELFQLVIKAQRVEDSAPVLEEEISVDVDKIYEATVERTDESRKAVWEILSLRNDNQMLAICREYSRRYDWQLEKVVRKEFEGFGNLVDALHFQLRQSVDKYTHQAKLLEDAMPTDGTNDPRNYLLMTRIVRSHWDQDNMARVREAYGRRYRKSLAQKIRENAGGDRTGSDYRELILVCIGAPIEDNAGFGADRHPSPGRGQSALGWPAVNVFRPFTDMGPTGVRSWDPYDSRSPSPEQPVLAVLGGRALRRLE